MNGVNEILTAISSAIGTLIVMFPVVKVLLKKAEARIVAQMPKVITDVEHIASVVAQKVHAAAPAITAVEKVVEAVAPKQAVDEAKIQEANLHTAISTALKALGNRAFSTLSQPEAAAVIAFVQQIIPGVTADKVVAAVQMVEAKAQEAADSELFRNAVTFANTLKNLGEKKQADPQADGDNDATPATN